MQLEVNFYDPETGNGNTLPVESFYYDKADNSFSFIPERKNLRKTVIISSPVIGQAYDSIVGLTMLIDGFQYSSQTGGYTKTSTRISTVST